MLKRLLIGTAISAFFFWLILRSLDVHNAIESLKSANWLWLIPAIVMFLFSFALRAVRWQILLAPIGQVGFSSSFRAVMIGFMANSVLPARMGEFVRAFVLKKKEGLKVESVFATIVVERIFDGYLLMLFLLGSLLLAPLSGTEGGLLRTGIVGALAVYTIALVAMLFLHHRHAETIRFFERLLSWFPWRERVLNSLSRFASGLAIFSSTKQIMLVAVWSLIVWIVSMAVLHPLLAGFDLGVPMPWYAPYVITPIVALGVLLPAAPGYAGTFHAACVAALLMLAPDSNADAGRAFAFVLHAANMVPIIVVGLIFLWLEGLSLSDLGKKPDA
jgi:uncharacterized protein (TIRG00374 family)